MDSSYQELSISFLRSRDILDPIDLKWFEVAILDSYFSQFGATSNKKALAILESISFMLSPVKN
ncbi:hypothetical protein OUZ56_028959 [Daphnia magna]|uniref:Uncharacterized protein n=1 Tax=Daphnia magna TaxID=35525 RepID=A0ABR0B5H4_9CRUS|nr:hypothetical protein OUZ56_028959 [Daphnia magna]